MPYPKQRIRKLALHNPAKYVSFTTSLIIVASPENAGNLSDGYVKFLPV
jgi:hypothetical protein